MTGARRVTLTLGVAVALVGVWALIPVIEGTSVDDGFVIDAFERDVAVGEGGTVEVTETIAVRFLEQRRGIFRDLEEVGIGDLDADHEVTSVDRGRDGTDWTWVVEDGDDGPRVRIGDEDVELDPGPQTYRLRYTATGQVAVDAADPEVAELRVDVPGLGWPVRVDATTLTVQLPAEPEAVACVVGAEGTAVACPLPAATDGTLVRQRLTSLEPATSGTVGIRFPAAALTGTPPTATLPDLDDARVDPPRFELPRPLQGLVLGLSSLPAIVLFEALRSRFVYRDRVTDPVLHDQPVPSAELVPPDDLAPAEVAVVLQRVGDAEDRFVATLVDLEQRGALTSTTELDPDTDEAADGEDVEVERVTLRAGPRRGEVRPFEAEFLDMLLDPETDAVTFDGEHDEDVATRVTGARQVLTEHDAQLRAPGAGIVHDGGPWLRGARGGLLGTLAALAALGAATLAGTQVGLPFPAALLVVMATLAGWAALGFAWRYHRQAFTSHGRHLSARVRAYRGFLADVHADQLEFGARQGVHHGHPAVTLLPYAIAFGYGSAWYDRFGPIIRQLGGGTGGGTDAVWWTSVGGYASFGTVQSGTTGTDASGAGGGGVGSGGGGGGGGSW